MTFTVIKIDRSTIEAHALITTSFCFVREGGRFDRIMEFWSDKSPYNLPPNDWTICSVEIRGQHPLASALLRIVQDALKAYTESGSVVDSAFPVNPAPLLSVGDDKYDAATRAAIAGRDE